MPSARVRRRSFLPHWALPFLTAVLVVHLTGVADRTSAIACLVYVVARIAHGLIYIAGIPKIRTLVFGIGALAVLVLLTRLRLS